MVAEHLPDNLDKNFLLEREAVPDDLLLGVLLEREAVGAELIGTPESYHVIWTLKSKKVVIFLYNFEKIIMCSDFELLIEK